MKILLGIDDSKLSGEGLRAIIKQFRPENSEVKVLHMLQPVVPLAPPEMSLGYVPEMEYQRSQPSPWLSEKRQSYAMQDSRWTPQSKSEM